MFNKPLPWEYIANVNWLMHGSKLAIAGALLGLVAASIHRRRVEELNRLHMAEMLSAHDDAYTMGRVDGMAEAFDVVVDHRQAEAR